MADHRCDIGLPSGKRCKNDATQWIHAPDPFDNSDWPIAVCEVHARTGAIVRLGPDRRAEYARIKRSIDVADRDTQP